MYIDTFILGIKAINSADVKYKPLTIIGGCPFLTFAAYMADHFDGNRTAAKRILTLDDIEVHVIPQKEILIVGDRKIGSLFGMASHRDLFFRYNNVLIFVDDGTIYIKSTKNQKQWTKPDKGLYEKMPIISVFDKARELGFGSNL